MDIILRVKRSRDEEPIDMIAINKKAKTFEGMFDNLSLAPSLVFKRVPNRTDIQKIDIPGKIKDMQSSTLKSHAAHARASRQKIAEKWRYKVLEKEDVIYCNGEAMVSYGIAKGDLDNCEIDEYQLCEDETGRIQGVVEWIYSDSSSDEEEKEDSEDSNREDHPWNEYPDQESDEDEEDEYQSSKSEDYEEYEVY